MFTVFVSGLCLYPLTVQQHIEVDPLQHLAHTTGVYKDPGEEGEGGLHCSSEFVSVWLKCTYCKGLWIKASTT